MNVLIGQVKTLRISLIRTDGGTQLRTSRSQQTIEEYAEGYKRGVKFPPVIVYFDGSFYWLSDGDHRLAAAILAGLTEIDCEVRTGTKEDAIWHSTSANRDHGLPRTRADARNAIATALRHSRGRTLSDRQIAEHVGVSPTTVGTVRGELEAAGQIERAEQRVRSDGRTYTVTRQEKDPFDLPAVLEPGRTYRRFGFGRGQEAEIIPHPDDPLFVLIMVRGPVHESFTMRGIGRDPERIRYTLTQFEFKPDADSSWTSAPCEGAPSWFQPEDRSRVERLKDAFAAKYGSLPDLKNTAFWNTVNPPVDADSDDDAEEEGNSDADSDDEGSQDESSEDWEYTYDNEDVFCDDAPYADFTPEEEDYSSETF